MNVQNMSRDMFISLGIIDVSDNKNAVETRKNSTFQLNLLINALEILKFAKYRIGSC